MGATSAASAAAGQAMQGQSGLAGAMVPGIFSSAQQAMQEPSGLAGAMFGLRRAVQEAQQTQQAQQVAAATPEQIAAGNANLANVDYGAEANPTMDQATAVNQTAFGAVPTVATGGFTQGAQQAAAGVFGTEAERQAAMQQAADVSEATYTPVGGNVLRPKRLKGLRF